MRMKLGELVAVLTKIQEVYGADLDTNVDSAACIASVWEKYDPLSNYHYPTQSKRTTGQSVRLECPEDKQAGPCQVYES